MSILISGRSYAGKTIFVVQLPTAFVAWGAKSQAISTDLSYREIFSDETLK